MNQEKILIIDDSTYFLNELRSGLRKLGYENVTATVNGKQALRQFDGHQIIITDWNMPVMGGMDFVKEIRAKTNVDQPYIIMLTIEGDMSHVIEAMNRGGVDNYFTKPFTLEQLEKKMKRACRECPQ